MFTRLLVGLDGSPRADAALEQAVVLGERFHSTVLVAHVREPGGPDGTAMLDRARERLLAAELQAEVVEQSGVPDAVLAALAQETDAVLLGRHGKTAAHALGPTVAAVLRHAGRCVIACAGLPSPMRTCAVAYDGGETSQRALELAVRFASVVNSTVHVIHAADDRDAGLQVLGAAEATLSMQRIPFASYVEPGPPGEVIARVIKRVGCDALFAGAHMEPREGRASVATVSHAEEILRRTEIPVVVQP
jgi:nucleotide-binding universal stress UspA family protein